MGASGLKHLVSPDSGAEDKVYGDDWEDLVDLLDKQYDKEVWVTKGSGSDLVSTWNAYAGERVINVPEGRYQATSSMVVPDDFVVLKGAGRYYDSQGTSTLDTDPVKGTVIQLAFNGNLFDATAGTRRGCLFENMTVYGKREGAGAVDGTAFVGMFKNSIWRNVGVSLFSDRGWSLGYTGGTQLYDNVLDHCLGYWNGDTASSGHGAIVIDTGCSDTKIIGGTYSNSSFASFEVLSTGGGNHRLLGTTLQVSDYGAYIDGTTANFDQCSIDQNDLDGILFNNLDASGGSSSVVGCKLRKCSEAANDTYFHIRLDDYVNTRISCCYFRHGGNTNRAKACIGWDNTTREPVYMATNIDAKNGANTLTNLGWDIVGGHTERQTDSIEEFVT